MAGKWGGCYWCAQVKRKGGRNVGVAGGRQNNSGGKKKVMFCTCDGFTLHFKTQNEKCNHYVNASYYMSKSHNIFIDMKIT